MAGLLEKDFRLILQNRQQMVFLAVLSVILGLSQEGTFILGYLPFCMMVFVTSLISYDEADHGMQFLMTLPVSPKIYVKEKYLFCMGTSVLSWAVAVALYFVSEIIHGKALSILTDMPMLLAFLPAFLLFLALMIPVQLKFGMEKSRFVLLGIAGITVVGVYLTTKIFSPDFVKKTTAAMDSAGDQIFIIAGGVLAVIVLSVSYLVSQNIMNKKEY